MSRAPPIFISLAPDAPGVVLYAAGSAQKGELYRTQFTPPILLDKKKSYVVRLIDSSVWYTSPNIALSTFSSEGQTPTLANRFIFSNTNGANGPIAAGVVLTLPTGLYSISDLGQEIARQTLLLGYGTASTPLFTFIPYVSSNIVGILVLGAGISIDFTQPNTIRVLLGFAAVNLGPSAGADQFFSTLVPMFSMGIDSYLIHCSLVETQSYLGGNVSDVVASVKLNAVPNSQILLQPFNQLISLPSGVERVSTVDVYVTDQRGHRISTQGNPVAVTLSIEEY